MGDLTPQKIDDMPLLKMLTKAVMEGPGIVMGAIGNTLSDLVGGAAGESREGGFLSSLKDKVMGGDNSPAVSAPSREPTMAIAAPAPSLGRHEVDMTELGNFSAPTFGSGASGRSAGMGM